MMMMRCRRACLVTRVAGLPTARVGSTAFVSEPTMMLLPAATAAAARHPKQLLYNSSSSSSSSLSQQPLHHHHSNKRGAALLYNNDTNNNNNNTNNKLSIEHRLQQLQRAAQLVLRSYGDVSTDVQCLAQVDGESLRFQCNHYGKGRFCLISKTEHFDNN